MLSTKDYEKLWFLYKLESEPRNLSVDEFCRMQGVPAESFNKWLDRRRKKIVEVQVEGIPESPSPETSSPTKESSTEVPSPEKKATTVIKSVNLDDMDKESLKGFAQFVLQSNEELKHDKEMLQRTVEGLSSQLKQANESLSNIERMLHSAHEKNAQDSLLIDELRGIVKTLEKQLDSANTYKKYKEMYEELRRML